MDPTNQLLEPDAFKEFNILLKQYQNATTFSEIFDLNGRISIAANSPRELTINDHSIPTLSAFQDAIRN